MLHETKNMNEKVLSSYIAILVFYHDLILQQLSVSCKLESR